ncbi:MAG: glutathione S-transferase family protein [Rhodospirillaceae bacterium]|nr:MAG: glutathione S-transferase family protein [Rhodospirillaceae bacterium]
MITLFHSPRSRSSRIIWLLEELAAPYEIKQVNIRRGDGSGALDTADPHPHGKVPAIIHDGALIFESAAIAAYLTDAFPKNGIGPIVGDKTRGPYLTWLAYYAGVMEPAFMSKFMKLDPPRGSAGWVVMEEAMAYVAATLEAGPYLLGEKFSAADVLFGSTFALFLGQPFLPKTPVLEAYVKRCVERPAYIRATAKDS